MKLLSVRAPAAFILLFSGLVAGGLLAAPPASAAACAPGTGVTVVVGSDVRCAGGGGRSATSAFSATGHSLTRVQRQPGAVCQVDGRPSTSCLNMPPSDAYWGLFWSNGTSGSWVYSSSGVDALTIPKGGWVGFAFQSGGGRALPGATPRAAARRVQAKPGGATRSTPSGVPGTAKTSTPPPTPTPGSTTAPTPSADAPTSADSPARAGADPESTPESSGSLGWVAAGVMVALLLGMWLALWRRRRAS